MSYNISTWNTKEIKDLKIPLSELHKMSYVEISLLPENEVEITGPSEGFMIEGMIENNMVSVDEIESYGTGSGSSWEEMILCLKKSTGRLVATQVWEDGDSITRLLVDSGEVTEEPVEL